MFGRFEDAQGSYEEARALAPDDLDISTKKLIVGLRYRAGETPVPIVVAKGRGDTGTRMCTEARMLGIPIVENAAFVSALAERHVVGDMIKDDVFRMAVEALVAAGISQVEACPLMRTHAR